MLILAHENIERKIVEVLRNVGYEVIYISEIDPSIPDLEVLSQANANKALLLTADKDFGELVYRQNLISSGICLARLFGMSPQEKATLVVSIFNQHQDELKGNFSVITPSQLRIRKK